MLYKKQSARDIEEVGRRLEAAAQARKFGVLAIHNLKQTMSNKGIDLGFECLVYEVCNPVQAQRVLEVNPEISTVLPCRISVYQEAGKTIVAAIRPTAMLRDFGAPALEPVARDVEEAMIGMIDEAAG